MEAGKLNLRRYVVVLWAARRLLQVSVSCRLFSLSIQEALRLLFPFYVPFHEPLVIVIAEI